MEHGSAQTSYRAACVQFNIERGEVAANLAAAEAGIRAAVDDGAELLVLPELWTSSFLADPSDTLINESREAEHTIHRLSEELSVMVIGGGIEAENGRYYNSCSIVDCGEILGSYRKIHLFSPIAENRLMSHGEKPLLLDTRFGRIGVAICYDIRFPELVRYYFHKGIEVLAVPSQWPEARSDHWRTMTRARAIENQVFVLGCNRTGSEESMHKGDTLMFAGDSRIVDPMGHVIGTGQGEEAPILADVELRNCRSMRRILPIHNDRQPAVYRELWQPIWDNPEEPKAPKPSEKAAPQRRAPNAKESASKVIPSQDRSTPTTKT